MGISRTHLNTPVLLMRWPDPAQSCDIDTGREMQTSSLTPLELCEAKERMFGFIWVPL